MLQWYWSLLVAQSYLNVFAISATLFLIWLFQTIKRIYNKLNKENSCTPDVNVLKKIIPPHINSGWEVCTVYNSVPLWRYDITFTFAPKNLYSCRTLLKGQSKNVLDELLDICVFSSLFLNSHLFEVKSSYKCQQRDVITVKNSASSMSLTSILLSQHSVINIDRVWFVGQNDCWMYFCPPNMLLTEKYGLWLCFHIQDLADSNDACFLHLLASYPPSTDFNEISKTLTSCLILLKEHTDSISVMKLKEKKALVMEVKSEIADINETIVKPSPVSLLRKRSAEIGVVEEPATIQRISSICEPNIQQSTDTKKVEEDEICIQEVKTEQNDDAIELRRSMFADKLKLYEDVLKEGFDLLYSVWEADVNTPGWEKVAIKEGVTILKMQPKDSCPAPIFKGTSIVKVPLSYLLQYITTLEYKTEYDNMFESGCDVEQLDEHNLTKIVSLRYINMWPVAGRDFCSVSSLRRLKDDLYGICVKAVEHRQCPPISAKVRGKILIGGFTFRILSEDPPEIELTYIARAELNGSIPQRIINRVAAEQPMYAGTIRNHCERRFKMQDPPSNGSDLLNRIHATPSWFEQTNHTLVPEKEETDDDTGKKKEDTKIHKEEEEEGFIEKTDEDSIKQLEQKLDLREEHYLSRSSLQDGMAVNDTGSFLSDTTSLGEILQFTDDPHSQISVSAQEIELPRDRFGHIDFITLGNQAAASLEQEFFEALRTNITAPVEQDAKDSSSWMYLGTMKDVVIMKKTNDKIHSFLGRGLVRVLPVNVWEAIKNPTTRFVYDNMLKRTKVVREISERHKIVHMRHETHACFVKQARDFIILTSERVEQQRYVFAATSVDIPECPPEKDCVRGKVIGSGWIIEPVKQDGKNCSLVTYISQVDFGGRLPTRLINFISKRQPLSLAFLREFLESAEI